MARLRRAIDAATHTLSDAGVASARVDAEELAAHVAGTSRGRLALLDELADEFFTRYDGVVGARAKRIPLQHITGTTAFGPIEVKVGPGVFIPRPETEAVLEWAVAQERPAHPLIVDLCTGSAALAVALARQLPSARVIGVEMSADALEYASRNVAGTSVELRRGDVRDPGLFDDLDGRVHLIVANPPYLPDGTQLEPEVAEHDPPQALFGGPDGTSYIPAITRLATRWLTDGGLLAVEHDDTASDKVCDLLVRSGHFENVTARTDFARRPRFVTARRKIAAHARSRKKRV
ncbi:MAG TPA: peptide chain release factor N(5)-glutamine methyltransferase [Mycobacterium sp.]|nr:peptide chain release factor N(5)-glutamine methyltransferase [Mycobacterium sp.]